MRMNPVGRNTLIGVGLFLVLRCDGAVAQGTLRSWERFDWSKQKITSGQIKALSSLELKELRGIVFGRRGRIFDEKVIQDYLKSRPWYKPNHHYSHSMLNGIERWNIDTIRAAEWKRHTAVQVGDLKFYQKRLLTHRDLGRYTLVQLRIMRAEIEALHGKRFAGVPWLQNFFHDRYWYRVDAKYSPRRLSPIERRNIGLLTAMETSQRHLQVAPGGMKAFQRRSIREEMLHGLGLYELRLLRNEVYARRGQKFQTYWIQRYFWDQPWYAPHGGNGEVKLSPIEAQNVNIIIRFEQRLHRELATKPVTPALLKDLSAEDARKLRNEIYARRGRAFNDPLLRDYFSSLDWYQPKRRFNEQMLTSIEKRNAIQILAYERHAYRLVHEVAA